MRRDEVYRPRIPFSRSPSAATTVAAWVSVYSTALGSRSVLILKASSVHLHAHTPLRGPSKSDYMRPNLRPVRANHPDVYLYSAQLPLLTPAAPPAPPSTRVRRYPRVRTRALVGVRCLILRVRVRLHLHQRHPLYPHPYPPTKAHISHLNQAASKTAHQGSD